MCSMPSPSLDRLFRLLPGPLGAIAIRFDRSPLDSADSLGEFVRTRASYVAQTSLFGYLRTRMGTRYRVMFEDEIFSAAIRDAAARVFGSCLSDLLVFTVARVGADGGLDPLEKSEFVRERYADALERALADTDKPEILDEARRALDTRLTAPDWTAAADAAVAFAGSERDLVRFAPVIDDFKETDGAIIMNSIRYRWRDVRRQLEKRLDGPAVCADWRARRAELSRSSPRTPPDPHR